MGYILSELWDIYILSELWDIILKILLIAPLSTCLKELLIIFSVLNPIVHPNNARAYNTHNASRVYFNSRAHKK